MNIVIVSEEDFLKTYKQKTYGYKALEICKKNNWLPMKNNPYLALIVGYLMGDGNLSKDRLVGDFRFYGNKSNLNKIKYILYKKFNLRPYKYYLHPKGGGYILRYNNAIFSRVLELSGVPRGDKVLISFKVPEWIMNSDKKIKSAFLKSLLDNELENLRKVRKGFSGFVFQMSKYQKYKEELVYFLKQIKKLLSELNITTSNINTPKYRNYLRKDNKISICANFRIHTNYKNRVELYNNISFFSDKQKTLYNSIYR